MSESSNSRRASLKNLNVQDKKRVANLIKELAKTGEERELALERLQEERVSFEEQLSAVQVEQRVLKQEREALKQRLEKSENLLKKYESQLKDVKTEKEEQDKLLKKKFQVQPQSTQTSPLVQALGTNSIKARESRKTHSTQAHAGESESKVNTSHDGRMRWSKPQVPVYSNTLFDVKVSDVEQNSETQSMSEEYQRSRVTDSSGLHELYLREYSIQLRLQEQQIEIQRQQVQLQQQLQLLQQQQQQSQQQPGLSKQRQEQQDNPQQQLGLTQQHEDVNQQKQFYPKQRSQEQQQQPLEYMQKLPPREQENTSVKEFSPTQQTNLLQKRSPDRRDQQTGAERQADTIPQEHQVRSPRQRDHHIRKNSKREHKARQVDRPQTEDRPHTSPGSLSRNHYHHLGYDVEKTSSAQEYHTERNKSKHNTDFIHNYDERHRVSNRKSPGKSYRINDATQVDLNNNEYFRPRSPGQKQLKDRYDMNGNLMQERGVQEYLSDSNEPYSETDSDIEHHHTSERPCHCGYYPNHIRQQYDQPISKRSHSKGNPDHKAGLQHHSPYITNTDRQSLLHDAHRSQVRESQPPIGHHNHHIHKGEYRRAQDMHEIHSSQDYHGVPYYVTHEHMREPAFEAAFYQPSELELSSKHQPRGHEFYSTRQLGFPTSSLSPPKLRLTDDLPSHKQQYFRPQINQDKSKDLLDDYIYNHRTAGHYNTKLNVGYGPMNEGNKQLTKRKISRRGQDQKQRVGDTIQGGRLHTTYPASEQKGKCTTLGLMAFSHYCLLSS